jgi:transcription-repair coupling factor (superfamily II helicase)
VAYAKNLACRLGISEIVQTNKGFVMIYEKEHAMQFNEVTDILDKEHNKYKVKAQEDLQIRVDTDKKNEELLDFITKILEKAVESK